MRATGKVCKLVSSSKQPKISTIGWWCLRNGGIIENPTMGTWNPRLAMLRDALFCVALNSWITPKSHYPHITQHVSSPHQKPRAARVLAMNQQYRMINTDITCVLEVQCSRETKGFDNCGNNVFGWFRSLSSRHTCMPPARFVATHVHAFSWCCPLENPLKQGQR
jgi:hypothetical protein